MKSKSLKPLTRAGVAVVTSALLMAAPLASFPSMAAENDAAAVQTIIASGLTMSTSYPGISVKAGDSISFGAVSLSGLAVAAIAGIILNAILPGNDYKFESKKDE